MASIQEKIIEPKLGLLELARQLGSVSQACKVIPLVRGLFALVFEWSTSSTAR